VLVDKGKGYCDDSTCHDASLFFGGGGLKGFIEFGGIHEDCAYYPPFSFSFFIVFLLVVS
jgi:hypothetical protein